MFLGFRGCMGSDLIYVCMRISKEKYGHKISIKDIYASEIDRYLTKIRKKDMTFILGARCEDGVVLVGDTKVTIDEGADYAYSKKIFKPFTSAVIGSAGASGLYKSFQNRMIAAVETIEGARENISTVEKFSIITENVIRDMHNTYGIDRNILRDLSILMALRMPDKAELLNFTSIGFPEPVNKYKVIGHGEPYGALFLKKMWRENMTMEKVALLGCFIIKIIQEYNIDNSVGYIEKFPPQIWFIPDIKYSADLPPFDPNDDQTVELYTEYRDKKYPIKELSNKESQLLINKINHQVNDFNSFFEGETLKLF